LFSVSNSSVQNVRVSVSSLPNNAESQLSYPTPRALPDSNPNDESLSSMISNFVSENLNKSSKYDDEETFDRRPLLELISELNRRHTLNSTSQVRDRTVSPSPTPSDIILPPKPLSPFRPMIVHKKNQVNSSYNKLFRQIYVLFRKQSVVLNSSMLPVAVVIFHRHQADVVAVHRYFEVTQLIRRIVTMSTH